jgi:hypothetical protein
MEGLLQMTEPLKLKAREELIRLTEKEAGCKWADLNQKQQSIAVAKFYIREIHNISKSAILDDDLIDGVVDGANDLGCDFVYRDDNHVLIIQTKYLFNQCATGACAKAIQYTYAQIQALVAANNNSGQSDDLIIAMAWKESSFEPGNQNSSSSAGGLLGVTSGVITELEREGLWSRSFNVYDPAQNISAGSQYLAVRIQWAGGNVTQGLDGYGTGSGYATDILKAATDLQSNPSIQTLQQDIHP